jgi:transcriptional regulator EpsA
MPFLSTLSQSELSKFLKVIQDSLAIRCHQELFEWLHDDIQHFLPHDILITAWGDFSLGLVHLDVVSHLPGLRTSEVEQQELLPLLLKLFSQWVGTERTPFIIHFHEEPDENSTAGDLIAYMRSALVQGIKDERGRHDCLYVCLSSHVQTFDKQAARSMEFLLPYIDAALRQVAHLPVQYPSLPELKAEINEEIEGMAPDSTQGNDPLGLSRREEEIIHWVCLGKTNQEIGMILDISFFTVKNHLQRIFRKLDVLNRAQAVAKCERLGIKKSAPLPTKQ